MKIIQKYQLNKFILSCLFLGILISCQNKETVINGDGVNASWLERNNRLSVDIINNTSLPVYIPNHLFCNRFGDTLFLEGSFKSEDGVQMAVYDFKPVKMTEVKKSHTMYALCKVDKSNVVAIRIYTMSFERYLAKTSKQSSQNVFKEYEKAHSYIVISKTA